LMMDAASAHSPFGLSALLIMYISLGVCWLTNHFYYDNVVLSLVLVLISGFVYNFVYLYVTGGISGEISMFYCFWRYMLPEALFNCIICIPVRLWTRCLRNEYIRGI